MNIEASHEQKALLKRFKLQYAYLNKQVADQRMRILDEAEFTSWSKGELSERMAVLNELRMDLKELLMQVMNKNLDHAAFEYEEISDILIKLRGKLSDRIEALNMQSNMHNTSIPSQPLRIEVQQTDAAGNIPNTWGTFNGDYAKWKSFRDRWVASMHDNSKVATIVKFQNLKAACVDAAEGALGEWDLTNENYPKAWERLQAIYEDDYMQVQEFMRKLDDLPHMQSSSSKSIRDIIDTVHKHIHGIKRYINVDDKHPYVVFAIIERMDTDTYRAWEKHRPLLAKKNANANKVGKHIPTWTELEEFLESEVTIRVHSEK